MWGGGAGGERGGVDGEAGTEGHWTAARERHRAPANVALNMPVASGKGGKKERETVLIARFLTVVTVELKSSQAYYRHFTRTLIHLSLYLYTTTYYPFHLHVYVLLLPFIPAYVTVCVYTQ